MMYVIILQNVIKAVSHVHLKIVLYVPNVVQVIIKKISLEKSNLKHSVVSVKGNAKELKNILQRKIIE
jgi:hypothetical protein